MGDLGRRGRWLRLAVVAAAAVLVVACAGSAGPADVGRPVGGGTAAEAPATAAPMPAGEAQGGRDGVSTANDDPLSAPRDDLRIVYTGSLQLVVADLPAALEQARAAVSAVGGYVGASRESNADEDSPVATITYRIPATRWAEALERLRGLASKVLAEETQATEVGGQIVDLEARIRNLRASEASLIKIAEGTGKISDLLEVQAQLTQVRGQIEQLDAQRAQLVDQVAYGTLVATFGLEAVKVEKVAAGWDPAKDVDAATATLIGVGQGIVSLGIWFVIVWLPFLLVLLVAAVVIRALWRRFAPPPRAGGPVAGWDGG